jgi:hypothetical protein
LNSEPLTGAEATTWRLDLRAAALKSVLSSPVIVALLVLALYALWLGAWVRSGHSSRDFVHVGTHFLAQSNASPAILNGPVHPDHPFGYDGQTFYYLALDPMAARYYMDYPSYRYTRIVYPLAARAVAMGDPDKVPRSLVTLNLLGIAIGTFFLALWLRRRRTSPWLAAVYGLYPGLLLSLERACADALAYGIVAAAVYLQDFGGTRRLILSGAVFGIAALTRETTIIFPAVYLIGHVVELRQGRPASTSLDTAAFGLFALVPLGAYKLFLWHWLGRSELPIWGFSFETKPLAGLAYWVTRGLDESQKADLAMVVAPGLIALLVAVWSAAHRPKAELIILMLNATVLVVFAGPQVYVQVISLGRVAIGVVLAAVVAVPVLEQVGVGRAWFWLAAGFWLSLVPAWLLLPLAEAALQR